MRKRKVRSPRVGSGLGEGVCVRVCARARARTCGIPASASEYAELQKKCKLHPQTHSTLENLQRLSSEGTKGQAFHSVLAFAGASLPTVSLIELGRKEPPSFPNLDNLGVPKRHAALVS